MTDREDEPIRYFTPLVTLIGSHTRECPHEDCPAKKWDVDDYVEEFTTMGALRAVDRAVHGEDVEALLALNALVPVFDLFLEGRRVDERNGRQRGW